jgi:outer membrane murein-binding lipoprotein Lpp
MTDQVRSLDALIKRLTEERDALRVQIHLASMDAKDEYERISSKVDALTRQYHPVKNAVEESAANVFAALGLAADELWLGFKRVRQSLTEV